MQEKQLWFRAKRYGWGWYPVTWQGWIILLLFVAVYGLNVVFFTGRGTEPTNSELFWFLVRTVVLVGTLIYVCYRHGETPGWRWGEEKEEQIAIFTSEGKPTGSIANFSEVHAKGLWHETVHIWIVTPEKKILMQKRSGKKNAGGGEWDNHGGHIAAGETPEAAIIREVKEEIGLTLTKNILKRTIRYSKSHSYKNNTFIENEHINVFIAEVSVALSDLKLDRNEVSDAQLFTLPELSVGKASDGSIIGMSAKEYQVLLAYLSSEKNGNA